MKKDSERKFNILFLFVVGVLFSSKFVFATIGEPYCSKGGDCEYGTLTVNNLTVKGHYLNVSVVNYNVTGNIDVNGDMGVGGDLVVDGNVTAEEYNGLFNWYINPDVSRYYIDFNKSHLSFNETNLNDTIDQRTLSLNLSGNLLHSQNITNPINVSWGYFNNGSCIVIGDLSYVSEC